MRSSWFNALSNPINIFMLVAAVAAGLLSAWWLFPIGLIFWVIMVLFMVFDPAVRLNQIIQERTPLPERFQTIFKRIERVQVSLFNSLSSAPSSQKRAFIPLQDELQTLVELTYQLCVRLTPLENYREVNTGKKAENELIQLQRLIDNIDDPQAKQGYQSARIALEDKVNQEKLAAARLARLDALLLNIAGEMETLLSETVNLRSMVNNELSSGVSKLTVEIQEQIQKLQTFEKDVNFLS
ncbi:MAG: hypothetical protein LWX83_13545 [Anaerolineae bacterium]|nr:hypothetical protein [Anaerolineae bacterium]